MNDKVTTPRPSRRLVWGVGLLALIMSVSTVLQVHHYGGTRPPEANTSQGRTHPVKIHERVVYLTAGEYGAAITSHVIAIGSVGVFLGLLLKSRAKKAKEEQLS